VTGGGESKEGGGEKKIKKEGKGRVRGIYRKFHVDLRGF
jgi:hypothetical protein